jgi:hypothetical protein
MGNSPIESLNNTERVGVSEVETPIRKRSGNPHPKNNLPPHLMQKGKPPTGGRPKKTEEQRRIEAERKKLGLEALEREREKAKREKEEFELIQAVHRLKMRNLAVLNALDNSQAYDDIVLRTLESGARTGNPSALKFLNDILGNMPTKEQPKPSIEIRILNKFS